MERVLVQVNKNNDNISLHFGHTPRFKLFNIVDGKVLHSEYLLDMPGHGEPNLEWAVTKNVDVIISDGMGPGVMKEIEENKLTVRVFAGIKGNADDAVKSYLDGTLKHDPSGIHSCGMCDHK